MSEWLAGRAESVITPPVGEPMAGYFQPRFTTGVRDDLFCRALVLQQGEERVALVSCDLISIQRGAVEEARRIIQSETRIPPQHVMVCCSHTHTGPYTTDLYAGELSQAYRQSLPARIAGVVAKAAADLAPARVSVGAGTVEGIAFNRRYLLKNGQHRTNPGIGNPDIERALGPVDTELGALKVERPDGSVAALWVNFAVHADVMGGEEFSADFPGALSRKLKEHYGEGVVALFANGACGDVNHFDVHGPAEQNGPAQVEKMAQAMAGAAIQAANQAQPVGDGLEGRSEVLQIPIRGLSDEEEERCRRLLEEVSLPEEGRALKSEDIGKTPATDAVFARAALRVQEERRVSPTAAVEAQALRVGSVKIAALPVELFAELGLQIKRGAPRPPVFLACYANGIVGYVPTRRAFEEGGYETMLTTNSKLEESAGERLVEEALRLLKRLEG